MRISEGGIGVLMASVGIGALKVRGWTRARLNWASTLQASYVAIASPDFTARNFLMLENPYPRS